MRSAELEPSLAEKNTDWHREMIDAPGTPRAGTWVAVADGVPVGFAHFREAGEPAVADLTQLHLHPDAWGQEVARLLLEAALDDMRTLEFRAAEVQVFADQARARRFYERAGFRETEDAGAIRTGDSWIGVAHYRLGL